MSQFTLRNELRVPNPTLQTWSATLSVILAMVLYPEILAKAQAELDRVVGTDRLPSFNDQPNLPYVTAICKEVCGNTIAAYLLNSVHIALAGLAMEARAPTR